MYIQQIPLGGRTDGASLVVTYVPDFRCVAYIYIYYVKGLCETHMTLDRRLQLMLCLLLLLLLLLLLRLLSLINFQIGQAGNTMLIF